MRHPRHNTRLPACFLKWIFILPFIVFLPLLVNSQKATLSRQLIFKEMDRQDAKVFLEDSYGFLWIGSDSLFRYDGHSIQPFQPVQKDSAHLSTGAIYALLEDSQKRVWIGGVRGLFYYERETDQFRKQVLPGPVYRSRINRILSLMEDSRGKLWVGDRNHLYVSDNPHKDSFQLISGIDLGLRGQGLLGFTCIVEANDGEVFTATNQGLWWIKKDLSFKQYLPEKWKNVTGEFQILHAAVQGKWIWLATSDGLWQFDTEHRSFFQKALPAEAGRLIRKVIIGKENDIWIASTDNGLFRLDGEEVTSFSHDPDNTYSIIDNRINSLLFDRFDNLWIGTMIGISRGNFDQQKFPFYQIDPGPFRYNNYTFRVMQDSLGGFWFRLLRQGLGYSPGLGKEVEILLQPEPGSKEEEIKNFCLDPDGNVWVTTLTRGLYKFPKGQKQYEHIDLGDSMQVAYTHTILSDRTNGRYLWFSSKFGLCRVDRFTFDRAWFDPGKDLDWMDQGIFSPLEQSEDGNFWCTVSQQGRRRIVYFDIKKEKFEVGPAGSRYISAIRYPGTRHIKSVPGNKIWLATRGEAFIIDATQKTFKRLTRPDGSPLENVLSVIPDRQGNVWFTREQEICKYDGTIYQCYDGRDDIERFNYWSAALGNDGRLTFGGRNGIYSFYPDDVKFEVDSVRPQVYLTNFKVFNKKRHLGQASELVREIRLPYEDKVITFEFSALHFLKSEQIRYRHRLLGPEKEWVETGSDERTATYSTLSPGIYTFQVQAANANDLWTPEEKWLNLRLVILPPWYRTWWAYGFYVLAAALILFLVRHYELRRQLARAEARRLQELDAVKSRLFTSITHEFRTPLTIILGMADQVRNQPGKWLKEGTKLIKRNGNRLLHLVNQLLDLSRLESGTMELQKTQGDIMAYLRYLVESFQSYAETKGISLYFRSELAILVMDYDPDIIQKIVSNLLSNAIKFTPPDGYISFQVDQALKNHTAHLQITVKDTGTGISADHLPHIFDRFFRGVSSGPSDRREGNPFHIGRDKEGVGIGLALTKELVQLSGGSIKVSSQAGEGTTFEVLLPLSREAPFQAFPESLPSSHPAGLYLDEWTTLRPAADTEKARKAPAGKALVLVVEDNPDVVRYLSACLEPSYQVVVAQNGQTGIEKAIEVIPDLIISDVMMPVQNGFELCDRLKNDEKTSHIPIVLLTAKADVASKIAGLERGADMYLAKPFHREELLVRLQNLIELRKKLQLRYQGIQPAPEEADEATKSEDAFLEKVTALVAEHMAQDYFDISWLAGCLFMSRVQLFRKIKALTDRSPSQFVRSVRLRRAKKLLVTSSLNISEIAYEIGFNSPAFFSRAFREEFGASPTELRERVQS